MKTILVTGGTGFIGSHTALELHTAGYKPVLIDNYSNSPESVIDGITDITGEKPVFFNCDYRDRAKLSKIIQTEKVDGIIHFAALKAVGESVEQPLKYYDNNVAGLIGLLELVQEFSLPFVFSSSCTVYGEPDKPPVDETAPMKPAESPYGATKQMGETILHDATIADKRLKSIALRYFNPVGAHPSGLIGESPLGKPSNLFPVITQAVAGLGGSLTVYGTDYDTPDGSCVRDYIHVVDLAQAHIKALEYLGSKPGGFYDVFNVGTGKGVSVLEVIKTFEMVTGKKVPHKLGDRRPGDVIETYADCTKAERELNWIPSKSLEDACRDAWRWQQNISKSS